MILVDLFAGAGGLSCGLEQAGFHPVLANELVSQFSKTYQLNHPKTKMVTGDIREVSESDIKAKLGVSEGDVDLVAGGPPCQGFSVNAPIRSLDDNRNHLFRDFLRVTKSLMPKAVLIENVPGMVSLGKGTVVKQIYKELEELGYNVSHRILFAGHYGIPQLRFRTIIVGLRFQESEFRFPEPEYEAKAIANFAGAKELCLPLPPPIFNIQLKKPTTVWDALSDLPEIPSGGGVETCEYSDSPNSEYQETLRKGSHLIFDHRCANLGKVNLERLQHIPQGGSWRDIPFELLPAGLQRARRSDHTKRYGRLHPDGMCSTILTKCDPHWGSFFHPEQNRVISIREAARIQSFPDTFHFSGSLTQQYEQVGNAVPPLLAKAVGLKIKETLEIKIGQAA